MNQYKSLAKKLMKATTTERVCLLYDLSKEQVAEVERYEKELKDVKNKMMTSCDLETK